MKGDLSRWTVLWLLAVGLAVAAPWDQPRTPVLAPIPGVGGLAAKDCGVCHTAIYQEWQTSSHAWAWRDAQFQGELDKDLEVGWLCLNCHTPVANQQANTILESGVLRDPKAAPNPSFDPALQADGIGCLSCHWRPGGIAAPHEDVNAPHPVVHDPSLRQATQCTTCHQAKATLEDALTCHFNTGEEWEEAQPGQTCQGCHMPAVTRSVAPGAPPREGGHHTWFGGGVPKGPIGPEVQGLWDAWKPGFNLSLSTPAEAASGAEISIVATISHARAGHLVPTGDPERHLVVEVIAKAGDVVLQRDRYRIGQRWEWSPVAKKVGDNRLSPGESRDYRLTFEMPETPVVVTATVTHVRLTEDNLSYHIDLANRADKPELVAALRAYPLSELRASTEARITPRK